MVSALYAVLGALLLLKLSFNVVKLRSQYRVPSGDGGFYELQIAIRIHGNAIEYVPIVLILLIMAEMNGAQPWMIHLPGLLLLTGRLMHAYGLQHHDMPWRRRGMGATYMSLLLVILANIYYISWREILVLTQ